MTHDSTLAERPKWVSPPGDTIINILEDRELSVEQFACQIGRSISSTQELLDGKIEIDAGLARALARTIGASERFWTAREYDYRACVAPPQNVSVNSLAELLEKLPFKDMQKFGWIPRSSTTNDRVADCLTFFGVSTLAQWQGRYDEAFHQAAYRRSAAHASCEVATAAWLRQGEIETLHDQVDEWSSAKLEFQLDAIKRLTWFKSPSLFLPRLKNILAGCGVKFAVVRAPKGCAVSGAVRILNEKTPHIQLSFRFLSDDQFWFSLFHEIAHLILHFDHMPILESLDQSEDEYESEANQYAANVIVPMWLKDEFNFLGSSKGTIIAFAKKAGVAPGLIVGRLQYDGVLRYNQMQHLKRRFAWLG